MSTSMAGRPLRDPVIEQRIMHSQHNLFIYVVRIHDYESQKIHSLHKRVHTLLARPVGVQQRTLK